MMATLSHLLSAIAAALLLFVLVDLLRRRQLRERHAVWWLVLGTLGLVVTVFPSLLTALANLIGVAIPLNLAFFGAIVVLFLVSIQQSKEVTQAEERIRTLAEQIALLEDRVMKLESRGLSEDLGSKQE